MNFKSKFSGVRNYLISLAAAGAFALGGCGGGGGDNNTNPPIDTSDKEAPAIDIKSEPTSNIPVFEHMPLFFEAEMTDNKLISTAEVQYRPKDAGYWNSLPLTNTSGHIYSGTLILPADNYDFRFHAKDPSSNEVYSPQSSLKTLANEITGDSELEMILQGYKSAGDIEDFVTNAIVDCDGMEIEVDAVVYLGWAPNEPPSQAVIWYQGENDGYHVDAKNMLDIHQIKYSQIDSCTRSEIETRLGEIRDSGWVDPSFGGGELKP